MHEDMSMIGHLYFQKGMCYEKLNRSLNEIKDCYKNSLFLFQIISREKYIDMVLEKKGHFIDDV